MNTTRQKPDYISTLIREGCEVRADKIPCPFHFPDKTPSFVVYSKTQAGHCFGCGWHGDIIAFIMQYKNLSFKNALAYLGISNTAQNFKSKTSNKKQQLLKAFRQWERDYLNHVCMLLRGIRKVMAEGFKDMNEAEQYSNLFHAFSVLDYHHDFFCGRNDDSAKYELFMEAKNATRRHF